MTNIGIVTTWFDRGAAYVSKAYLETLKKTHNVFIYARGGELFGKGDPSWDHDYVTWGRQIRLGIPGYIDWKDFKNWLKVNKIDLIIFNEQQSWNIILKTLKLGVLIGAYVDYYTPETIPYFYLYDFLLCNTKRHFSVFQDHPQALYIPWGTDCNVFTGNNRLALAENVTFFHSCGYSPYRKGTDLLLKSFQSVHGNVRLIIHSQIPIKDNELRKIINNDPRIKLIIDTIPPPGMYHVGDVYVYPTRLEGIGLTIPEALASNLPVITTDNPPMSEFVVSGVNGRLVQVEKFQRRSDNYFWAESVCSIQSLSEAMQYYVDDQINLEKYKQQARVYAVKYLDWSKNSGLLSDHVPKLKTTVKNHDLIMACYSYEYKQYPKLIFEAFSRKIKLARVK